jgi:hypothetical protein
MMNTQMYLCGIVVFTEQGGTSFSFAKGELRYSRTSEAVTRNEF